MATPISWQNINIRRLPYTTLKRKEKRDVEVSTIFNEMTMRWQLYNDEALVIAIIAIVEKYMRKEG